MRTNRLTIEEKVKIVQEAEQNGFTETALKYNISSRQIYRWREKFATGGTKALVYGSKIDPELKALKDENDRLKMLVAKQALAIEVKDELLKKTLQRKEKNS